MDIEKDALFTAIQELEDVLKACPLVLFDLFLVGDKRLFNSCLEKIYSNFPLELKEKKDYLISTKKDNIFSYMYQIQNIVNSCTFFNKFVFLSKSRIESLIDLIYAELPNDIGFVTGKIQNNTEFDSQMEIPNFLRKDKK